MPPYTDYLYLTDSAGQVIAQEAVFGVRSARMKKIFNAHVRGAVKPGEKPSPEILEMAGRKTLAHLLEIMPAWQRIGLEGQEVRLYRVEVLREEQGLIHHKSLIAVYTLDREAL